MNNFEAVPKDKIVEQSQDLSDGLGLVIGYEIVKGIMALASAIALYNWHLQLFDWLSSVDGSWSEHFGRLLASPMQSLIVLGKHASQNWVIFLVLIIAYAILRFVEAYGLWKEKSWAFWLSVIGYGMFIPIELFYLVAKPFDWVKFVALILNCIVVFIVYRHMSYKGII